MTVAVPPTATRPGEPPSLDRSTVGGDDADRLVRSLAERAFAMVMCPKCQGTFPAGTEVCPRDGEALVAALGAAPPASSSAERPEGEPATRSSRDVRPLSTTEVAPLAPAPESDAATAGSAATTAPARPGAQARRAAALSPTLRQDDLAGPELTGDSRTRVAARSAATTRPDAMVGLTLLGRYEVTRKIGEGGMGAVYEARHVLIGKRVAIKVLLDKYAQKENVIRRLQQEARLASSIGHPNIVDITDFGKTEDGRTFVVMEYLDGESLAQLIAREGPIPPERALAVTRQVADALAAAHGKGIIHRDVKPENVFLCKRDERDYVKVVDFGISKSLKPGEQEPESPRLTQTGMVLGTPLYMSPEQARGEDQLDHRIDVYALGMILYEMITGEVPFRGTNYLGIISQVLTQDVVPPRLLRPDLAISEACERVILKAMAKDREERYQSMGELATDLDRLITGDQNVSASVPTSGVAQSGDATTASLPVRRTTTQIRPRRLPSWLGGLLLGGVGIALFVAVLRWTRTREELPAMGHDAGMGVLALPATQPASASAPARPTSVRVRIASDPPGARVEVGGRERGVAPVEVNLPFGTRPLAVRAQLEGYEEASETVIPNRDALIRLALRERRKPARPGARRPPTSEPAKAPTGSLHETLPSPYKRP
jgi:serine/threonine-protein kinase